MFDWFFKFLYVISRSLFQVLDAMVFSAKKLCGIDEVYINGDGTDFLSFLIRSDGIQFAFAVAVLASATLVVLFAIIAIIRTIVKEKGEPPMKIAVQAVKNIFIFMFVPVSMIATILLMNTFADVMYTATLGDECATLGGYIFTTFAEAGEAWQSGVNTRAFVTSVGGTLIANYSNTSDVGTYIVWSDYSYVMSWIASILLMFPIGNMLIMFVDRAISIAILYISAPFTIASSMVDDGSRFKLWREQVLVKFITGYGAIISLNVYAICLNLVMSPNVVFFPDSGTAYLPFFSNSFLNYIVKLVFMIGGAFSMQKIMALVGNLVSAGAGSNELRDSAIAGAGFGKLLKGAAGIAGKVGGAGLKFLGKATGVSDVLSRTGESIMGGVGAMGNYFSNKMLGATALGRAMKSYTDKKRDDAQPLTKKVLADVLANRDQQKQESADKKENNATKTEDKPKSKGQNMLQNSISNSTTDNTGNALKK